MREPIETLGRRVKWKWLGRLEKEEGLERERDRDKEISRAVGVAWWWACLSIGRVSQRTSVSEPRELREGDGHWGGDFYLLLCL